MDVSSTGGGSLRLRLEEHERRLLQQLAAEMRTLLEADVPRADPVVRRLFPDAYDDAREARSFHDLVAAELRDTKTTALREVTQTLSGDGELAAELTADQADAWLKWLTDVRLAIGTRLDVDEQAMAADVDPDSTDAAALSVLHWLGWIQESIVANVTRP